MPNINKYKYLKALNYTYKLHYNQFRKKTNIPYFFHLSAVSNLIIENGGTTTEAIAGLLHDAVEDQGGQKTLKEISKKFGKKAKEPVIEVSEIKEEVKKIDTSYDDLDAYQKMRDAERTVQLEKEREKLKKKEIKFNFTTPKKDWSIYGGWVNAYEPINKGRLGSTQEWRIEKPKKHYY